MSFKGFIKTNYLRFIYINFLSIISGLGAIGAGYVQMYWLTFIKNKNWMGVLWTSLAIGVLYLAAQGLIYYIQFVTRIQEEEYNKKIRNNLASHYFKDNKYHKIAAAQNRMTNDLEMVRENYFDWYIIVPFYGTMFVGALVALLTIHWQIFVVSIVIDIASYYIPKLVQKKMEKATTNVSVQNKHYLDVLEKWFSGVEELRRYFAGAKLFQVQSHAANKIEKAHVHQTGTQQELIVINGLCNSIGQLILLSLTGYMITQGQVLFGAIMSVQNFAANISIGLQQMIQALSFMKSSEELMDQISSDSAPLQNNSNIQKKKATLISTENLALAFLNGEKLSFPDIQIKSGEKILLTGDSGAGKSTLFKLILGSIKPTQGSIIFKDKDGKEINPDMSKIGYIPQDPNLFPGTIEENITMFNSKLNSQVEPIIKEVNFANDISKFKEGLEHQLNLDKLNISGGQRQKIVLARAKVHGSDIILIDEGTSAIDQKATMNILKNLVKGKETIIFIAHNFNQEMRALFDREIHLVKA